MFSAFFLMLKNESLVLNGSFDWCFHTIVLASHHCLLLTCNSFFILCEHFMTSGTTEMFGITSLIALVYIKVKHFSSTYNITISELQGFSTTVTIYTHAHFDMTAYSINKDSIGRSHQWNKEGRKGDNEVVLHTHTHMHTCFTHTCSHTPPLH